MMELPERERNLTISAAVWIQSTNVTDGRTDRQTRADSKDRAYA